MTNRGVTLIELVVVVGMIGILLSLATFGFSQYSRKSQITNQTRLLYGDLMEYRTKALYEKKNWTFKISATSYGIYSSPDITVAPVSTVVFKYPVENLMTIEFDTRGLTNNLGTVCVTSTNNAVVDSVVISKTRVQIGKKKEGVNCDAGNIDAK